MAIWRDPRRVADTWMALSPLAVMRRGIGVLPWGVFVRSSMLLAGLAALGFVGSKLAGGFSFPMLQAALVHDGPWGVWLFLALATGLIALGAPRQAITFAGAYLYGFWLGLALGFASAVLSAALDFGWARGVGRATVRRRLGGRLAKIDGFLAKNPFKTSLMLRLLPIGNNVLIGLVAGVSGMGATKFLLGSAIGYVPQTVIFALIGTGTRIDPTFELVLAIGLFVVSAAIGVALFRREVGTFSLSKILRIFSGGERH